MTSTQCDRCHKIIMNSLERVERPSVEGDTLSSRVILCRGCAEEVPEWTGTDQIVEGQEVQS